MTQIKTYTQLADYMRKYISGKIETNFWMCGGLDEETLPYVNDLLDIQDSMITTGSQPGEIEPLCETRAFIDGFIKTSRLKYLIINLLSINKTAIVSVHYFNIGNIMDITFPGIKTTKFPGLNYINVVYHNDQIVIPDDIPLVILKKGHPVYGINEQNGGSDAHHTNDMDFSSEYNFIPHKKFRNWMISNTNYITIIDMELGKNTLFKDVCDLL